MFGDSLSAGYGIAVAEIWPSLPLQELAHSHVECCVVNASISGEAALAGSSTSTGSWLNILERKGTLLGRMENLENW